MKKKMVLLLGAPGSGKGTLGMYLTQAYGFTTLSTGNVIRKEIENRTPLGVELEAANKRGEFFSDEIALQIGVQGLSGISTSITLDGFPRNLAQAKLFDEHLNKTGGKIDYVIYLNCHPQTVVNRLANRRVCPNCGATYNIQTLKPKNKGICDHCSGKLITRDDDRPQIIQSRLNTYREKTEPLIDYYRTKGSVKEINGDESFEEIKRHLDEIIKESD